jgi:predicted nuclease with TOPRIM domain
MKELNALTKEHEKLKDSHASLVSRYENFSFEQPCATNSIYRVAQLEKANCELKAQLEDLTSKHVALQEKYDDLSCSHEKLVDSDAMLDIAHEVMVTSVNLISTSVHAL